MGKLKAKKKKEDFYRVKNIFNS